MLKSAPMFLAAALAVTAGAATAHPGHQHARGGVAKSGALTCPVMKSTIKDKAKAPHVMVNNVPVYVCCNDCPAKLKAEPAKYLQTAVKDPVTGKSFKATAKTPKEERAGAVFLFSSAKTKAQFDKAPARYTKPRHS